MPSRIQIDHLQPRAIDCRKNTAVSIAALIKAGYDVIIAHGEPQVEGSYWQVSMPRK